jgi:hypothetical protein
MPPSRAERQRQKPDEITVELTIPTDAPHACSVDKLQV